MRAQVNQAFIYVFVLIIISSIVLISFILFNRAADSACEAELITFSNALQRYANQYSDYGNLHRESISAPCGVTELCILNPDGSAPDSNAPFVLEQLLESGGALDNNVIIKQDNVYKPLTNISELSVEAKWDCIDADGSRFKLDFEGKGKYTVVRETVEVS